MSTLSIGRAALFAENAELRAEVDRLRASLVRAEEERDEAKYRLSATYEQGLTFARELARAEAEVARLQTLVPNEEERKALRSAMLPSFSPISALEMAQAYLARLPAPVGTKGGE